MKPASLLFLVLLGALTARSAAAQYAPRVDAASPDTAIAFRRVASLQRGINLSGWFWGAVPGQKPTGQADLRLIHDAGFQYVRLGIEPTQLTAGGLNSPPSQAALAKIDDALDQILAAKLAVLITIFPDDAYKHALDTQRGADDFLYLWRFLARHFAARDAEHVFYELLNEPEVNDPYRWDGLQAATIEAVRHIDASHTIIATAARYSSLDDLLRISPVRDSNVIYNFHYYSPYEFTHQGATWGSSEWLYFHDVPYPATGDDMQRALASVPDANARYVLFGYAVGGWNQHTIEQRLAFVRAWADEHHVPVICNEFGAFRDTAPADSRVRYLHDVRVSLEDLHIGWAMWDYSGNFGLVTRDPEGKPHADPAVLHALGLR